MHSKPMTITLKDKTQLLVPPSVRRQARLKAGDRLEFKATPGMITIVSKPPQATGEYTPEQRRVIDARLAKALEEVDTGRTYGPFESHEAMMAFLNRRTAKAQGKRTIKSKVR